MKDSIEIPKTWTKSNRKNAETNIIQSQQSIFNPTPMLLRVPGIKKDELATTGGSDGWSVVPCQF